MRVGNRASGEIAGEIAGAGRSRLDYRLVLISQVLIIVGSTINHRRMQCGRPSPATLSRADPPQTAFGEGEGDGDQREVPRKPAFLIRKTQFEAQLRAIAK